MGSKYYFILSLVCWLTLLQLHTGKARELWVSHHGNNTKKCGQSIQIPCKTIQQAVAVSQENDVINVDSTGGVYTVLPPTGDYVNISHSLHIRSLQGIAKLTCKKGQGMFNVFSHQNSSNSVTLSVDSISVTGCRDTWLSASIFQVNNATVNLKNSKFAGNGVILQNPTKNCSYVQTVMSLCNLVDNGIGKPYLPAIQLYGCDKVQLDISDSQFNNSAVQVKANSDLKVNIARASFNSQSLKGVVIDIILSQAENQVSITDSSVEKHTSAHTSAVQIAVENQPSAQPSIHFNNVTFRDNLHATTPGAAVAVFARFSTHFTVGAQFNDCLFVNNSANVNGGALYLEGVTDVRINRCRFTANTAVEGGAIYLTNTHDVQMSNSNFSDNQAVNYKTYKGVGGAVFATSSDIFYTACAFYNNSAGMNGQSLHMTNMSQVSLRSNYFENSVTAGSAENIMETFLVQSLRQSELVFRGPAVTIANNTFRLVQSQAENQLFVARILGDLSQDVNYLCCPAGQHRLNLKQPSSPFEQSSTLSQAWCSSCPVGTYNLKVSCFNWTPDDVQNEEPQCKSCPQSARCEGNGQIAPLKHYWGSPVGDDIKFSLCPQGLCDKPNCTSLACCVEGRTGILCGKCLDDYSHNLGTNVCTLQSQCQYDFTFAILYTIAFSVVYLCVILLFICLSLFRSGKLSDNTFTSTDTNINNPEESQSVENIEGEHSSESSNENDSFEPSMDIDNSVNSHSLMPVPLPDSHPSFKNSHSNPSKTNIVINQPLVVCSMWMLVQMLEDVYQPSFDHTDTRYRIVTILTDLVNLRPPFLFLNTPCGWGDLAAASLRSLSFLGLLSTFVVLLLIFLIVNCAFCICMRLRHLTYDTVRGNFNAVMVQTFLVLVMISYVPMTRAVFTFLTCVNPTSNQSVLFINGEMQCRGWWFWVSMVFVLMYTIPVAVSTYVGVKVLERRHISCKAFISGLLAPLFSAVYWEARYGKRLCRCCCSYEYVFDMIHSGSVELNQSTSLKTHQVVTDFLKAPFRESDNSKPPYFCKSTSFWVIVLFYRGLVLVAVSTLLAPAPVTKSVAVTVILMFITGLHCYSRPFTVRLAKYLDVSLLAGLCVISVLGISNLMVYSQGGDINGNNRDLLNVCDWIYTLYVVVLVAVFVFAVLYRILKAYVKQPGRFER